MPDHNDRSTGSATRLPPRPAAGMQGAKHSGGPPAAPPPDELRAENEQLREIAAELKAQFAEISKPAATSWEDREREYEALLDEKSEMIRTLHVRIQELEAASGSRAAAKGSPADDDPELLATIEELSREQAEMDKERALLDEDRRQLRQDEEDMESRMQEMELQVAKSRSDLVRQRHEVHELYGMVRVELEKGQQSGVMSDRLKSLLQRHQTLGNSK